jgi:WD40 repeat protein
MSKMLAACGVLLLVQNTLAQNPLPVGAIARVGNIRLRHQAPVQQLDFLPDGTLGALDDRGCFRVWDSTTGLERRSFVHETLPAPVDPDDVRRMEMLMVRAARWGRRFRAFDFDERAGPSFRAFSCDGRYLAVCGLDKVTVWDMTTRKAWRTLAFKEPEKENRMKRERHFRDFPFRPLAFSVDGRLLAASGLGTGLVQVWDLVADKELHALRIPVDRPAIRLKFFPGATILAGLAPDQVMLWDLRRGKRTRTYQSFGDSISALAISNDGRRLATAGEDEKISLWEDTSEEEVAKIPTRERAIVALAFSPDGRSLAAAQIDNRISLFDTEKNKEIKQLEGHDGPVGAVAWSADGKMLASADFKGRIRLWDVARGKETIDCENSGPVVFTTNAGDSAVLLGEGDGSIHQVDLLSGKVQRRFSKVDGDGGTMTFSPDGKTLALVGEKKGGDVRIWDVVRGKELRTVSGDGRGDSRHPLGFTPDGKRLALLGEEGGLQLFDIKSGEMLALPGFHHGERIAFAPDGRSFITLGQAGQVHVCEMATGKVRIRFQGPGRETGSLVISPDSRQLATSRGEIIRLWSLGTGKVQRALVGHTAEVTALVYSRDGARLASGSSNGTLRVWDLKKGESLQHFTGHRDAIRSLTFSLDGKTLVSGSADGTALIWDLEAPQTGGTRPKGPSNMEALWTQLGVEDAEESFAAVNALVARRDEATTFLKKSLSPELLAVAEDVRRLIEKLDDKRFPVRERAMQELTRLGGQAEPALRKALAEASSKEVRQRIQQLLTALSRPATPGMELRLVRAVEVLEQIDTPAARQLLSELSHGAAGARLTEEAKAALERMTARAQK